MNEKDVFRTNVAEAQKLILSPCHKIIPTSMSTSKQRSLRRLYQIWLGITLLSYPQRRILTSPTHDNTTSDTWRALAQERPPSFSSPPDQTATKRNPSRRIQSTKPLCFSASLQSAASLTFTYSTVDSAGPPCSHLHNAVLGHAATASRKASYVRGSTQLTELGSSFM